MCMFFFCVVHGIISVSPSRQAYRWPPGTEVKEMLDLTATWSQQSFVGSKFSRNDLQWTCKFQSCFGRINTSWFVSIHFKSANLHIFGCNSTLTSPPQLSVRSFSSSLQPTRCQGLDVFCRVARYCGRSCGLRTNTTRWFRKSSKALKMNSLWIRQVQSICVVDVTDVTCWHVLVGKSQRKISKSGTVRGEFEVCASRMNRIVSRHGLSADTCLHQTIMFNVLKLLKSQGPIQNSSHST